MLTYLIKGPWSGELAIIPRPRGGDWLEDEARNLQKAQFDIVVSLLTAEEAKELGLTGEAKLIQNQGLQFCNHPIPDLGVPPSRESAREFLAKLHRELLAGKKIAIHCRGSIGRSGLVASGILVLAGVEPTRAFREVSDARGYDSPETAEQRDWVMNLALEPAASPA
jgi:protein-tyrosine phosphatase